MSLIYRRYFDKKQAHKPPLAVYEPVELEGGALKAEL